MESFCKSLPKLELHAHLNGSLSETTLKKLGALQENIAEYQRLKDIFAKTNRTLDECFELFKVAHRVTNNKLSVYTATAAVIDEFYHDNCIYLEIRTTPRAESDMSKRDYIESVVNAILDNKNDIIVKLLLSIDRRHDLNTSNEVLDLIIELKNVYPSVIVGVDLCGHPNEGCFNKELFSRARENGLKVSLHCGEVKNDDEVLEMLKFVPDRIGHATFVSSAFGGSDQCWELYIQLRIPVECCLTSNVVCGTVRSYKDHHLQEWIQHNLPFSLTTDDKGVFCTTLSSEYYHAFEHFDLTDEKLWQISYNSVEHAFTTNEEKCILQKKLTSWKNRNVN